MADNEELTLEYINERIDDLREDMWYQWELTEYLLERLRKELTAFERHFGTLLEQYLQHTRDHRWKGRRFKGKYD